MSIMNRQSNRHLPLNPTEQVIGSWGLDKWIGASLIEYWNVLIRLLDVCLVCKVRLYTNQKWCQLLFAHSYRGYTLCYQGVGDTGHVNKL